MLSKDITIDIYEGDFITIMGPSGAGKSTFLHILGTLDKPSEGDIFFRDRNFKGFTEEEESKFRNEKIGFVFQFYHLLQDFNVIENIMMPLLIKRINQVDAVVKAENFLEIMGLKHRRDHKPGELSGGEQQLVAVARALVMEPEILLADEPTGNLDTETGRKIEDILLELNRRKRITLIVVTHNQSLADRMSRSIGLRDGEIYTSV